MQNLFLIIIVSILAESIWETLKMTWQNGKVSIDRIGALVISLVITLGTKMDLLALLGLETTIPYMGSFLTGIIVSRGSNFAHDLLTKVNNVKQ